MEACDACISQEDSVTPSNRTLHTSQIKNHKSPIIRLAALATYGNESATAHKLSLTGQPPPKALYNSTVDDS